jgi:hypothetical protein
MDAVAVQKMLLEDRREWRSLVTSIERHPHEALHDPESPQWTSRDVYTHLASWMEHSTGKLEALLAGRTAPSLDGTDDEINAVFRATHSQMSLDEARAWARREFDRRIEAIEAVPPQRWDPILEAVARADGAQHYRAHHGYIAVFRRD